MTYNNRLSYLFLYLLFFVSCAKPVTEDLALVDLPAEDIVEVSSFSFSTSFNSSLRKDLALTKDQETYSADLPTYMHKKLIPTFSSNAAKVLVNNVEVVSAVTEIDFTQPVKFTFVGVKGGKKEVTVVINWKTYAIPQIAININEGKDVIVKDTYLKADLIISGNDLYPNYTGITEVKGRGNSTWGYPKKPYRLKLSAKAEILGMPAAKNWVLLANYLDSSLMCNVVAMKIGRDLGVPYTNETIPVDLTINGTYRGSYLLTQQIEVDDNRINIGKDGYLFELDSYFDEDYKFKSINYNLPVMIKSPELVTQDQVIPIKADFQELEDLIFNSTFPNNNYTDLLYINVFAKYILVYFLTGNEEINHPKSIYINKKTGGKYNFGPIWDFDWAFGYEGSGQHFTNANRSLFWSGSSIGTKFFKRLFEDKKVQTAFKNEWNTYKQKNLSKLIRYIDEYASQIRDSKAKDVAIWNKGKDFDAEVIKLKMYLQNRALYIDSFVSSF